MPPSDSEVTALLGRFAILAAASSMFLGCCVLLGWILQSGGLFLVPAALLAVHPLTAVMFVAAGASLRGMEIRDPRVRRLGQVGAALLIVLAILNLAGFGGGYVSLDHLFMSHWKAGQAAPHVAPLAIVGFLFIGLALLFLELEWPAGLWPAQIVCAGGLAVALQTLTGYGYGIRPLLYRGPFFDAMELNVALAFAVLNLGILCARPQRGIMVLMSSEGPGGSSVRLLLPAMIIIPTSLATVRLLVQSTGLYDSTAGSSLFGLANVLIFAILIFWNAESLQQMNRERLRAEEKAREAAELKVNFVNVVAHELRAPLTCIKLGIDNVLDGSEGTPTEGQRDCLSIAKRNVDRLARLINDVLDFQKLDSGRMPFFKKSLDINVLLDETAQAFSPVAKAKGLDLALELAQGLPRVSCDKDKISQVVINLLNNAVKFSERGRVTIKSALHDGQVRVSVQDEGPGIRKEDMDALFKSFSQISSISAKKEGSGLGLAISRNIIESHGGNIGLDSRPGKGTTFYFTLPAETRSA
ncbi:MAG: HAMP domain-containing sensor histidine kinase [Elusimicrobia bacterium]|nr:HAMP domain-containing sensor histidine kinase [Elusimicrobiota bacterium]